MAHSGWTVDDIPSQTGRRALITGANSGIGYYAALELARHGAHVLLGCRDRPRGEAALAQIRSAVPSASVELLLLDLASLASVRSVAAAELARCAPLDLLINNAGVMAPKSRERTADGFEMQFGTNVLGHFALTALLLPALGRAAAQSQNATQSQPAPRIVTIASIAHKRGRIDFDDLQSAQRYDPMTAYRQSKLANLILSLELARRLRASGSPGSSILSLAAHPGVAHTPLFLRDEHRGAERLIRRGLGLFIRCFLNTAAQGAVPTLFAATAPDAHSGGYYGPQGYQEMRGGDAGPAIIAPQARDPDTAARLWAECERLTAIKLL